MILIRCIDAAYWEVYSRELPVLDRVKKQFPEAEPCILGDRDV